MILDPASVKNVQGIVAVNVSKQSLEFGAEGENVGGRENPFQDASLDKGLHTFDYNFCMNIFYQQIWLTYCARKGWMV